MSDQPPFAYRLDHRKGASRATLARASSYAEATALVERWVGSLRSGGARGAILIVEEAFETVVARYDLDPVTSPFEPGHGDPATDRS